MPHASPELDLYNGSANALCGGGAGLIVTPNLDHLRLLRRSRALRRAYVKADVLLNDSRFLDKISIRGRALCLPGSELAPMMIDALGDGSRVAVIGYQISIQAFLTRAYPAIKFEFFQPSMGYIKSRSERRRLTEEVIKAQVDLIFVCTGAPQSELLAAQIKRSGFKADILCCGSALNFLTGAKIRAPMAFRQAGAEWLWRFLVEPQTRQRYLSDALFLACHAHAFNHLRRRDQADFGAYKLIVGSNQA
jgi:exopolysaccharide biosynthesis WecB/TagA/CpsF family protein